MKFSNEYPDECKLVDDSGNGMLEFEINKGRFCFRLTAPYSEKRIGCRCRFDVSLPRESAMHF